MADEVSTYVIDACALIAYLRKEKGGGKLRELLKDSYNTFFMHSVTVGEVYYDSIRVSGKETAHEIFGDIAKLPINVIWTLDIPFIEFSENIKLLLVSLMRTLLSYHWRNEKAAL